jgi:hypothetical protein
MYYPRSVTISHPTDRTGCPAAFLAEPIDHGQNLDTAVYMSCGMVCSMFTPVYNVRANSGRWMIGTP